MEKHVGGIADAAIVADEDYIRRVTLDLIGRQPTMAESQAFAAERRRGQAGEAGRAAARLARIRHELGQLLERRDQLSARRRRS